MKLIFAGTRLLVVLGLAIASAPVGAQPLANPETSAVRITYVEPINTGHAPHVAVEMQKKVQGREWLKSDDGAMPSAPRKISCEQAPLSCNAVSHGQCKKAHHR